jgi:protein-disulfide isomerase
MTRLSALATALTLALSLPAPAQEQPLSDEARAALRAEIRAYLLDNPEVIFEAVAEYERRTAAAQAEMDGALIEINADAIFADGHSWVGGNPEGDVTLVEFMDYRCGFCRRAFPMMMDFVGTDGNVRLVIKELPILGQASEIMSRFAVAVQLTHGDEAYFAVHEQLLALQEDPTDPVLQDIAAELGLDGEALLATMRGAEVNAILVENRRLAQRLQISGTPSFIVGDGRRGQVLRGMVPADQLRSTAAEYRS